MQVRPLLPEKWLENGYQGAAPCCLPSQPVSFYQVGAVGKEEHLRQQRRNLLLLAQSQTFCIWHCKGLANNLSLQYTRHVEVSPRKPLDLLLRRRPCLVDPRMSACRNGIESWLRSPVSLLESANLKPIRLTYLRRF